LLARPGLSASLLAGLSVCQLVGIARDASANGFHGHGSHETAADAVEPRPESSVSWPHCLGQPPAWFASAEAIRIADNVLLYQRRSGGWPKDIDMARTLGAADHDRLAADKAETDSTIDNGATYTQLRYLARVLTATGLKRLRQPFLRGLDFLFAAQYPNGGWPQFFPLRKDYSRHITFNDGAMIGVMRLLRDVAAGAPPFVFVDEPRRVAAARAVERGLRVILQAQIRVEGRLTAWCAQHDELTLEPRAARRYELVSASGRESVEIVEYLMEIVKPDAEVVQSVEAAVAWLRAVKLSGLRVERVVAPEAQGGTDVVVRPDPGAPPLWARFYEIGSNRPIFVGRDGVVHYALSEIEHERRTNYSWLGPYATSLLERDYPKWRLGSPREDPRQRPEGTRPVHVREPGDGGAAFRSRDEGAPHAPYLERRPRPAACTEAIVG